jgi:hypothetical protein
MYFRLTGGTCTHDVCLRCEEEEVVVVSIGCKHDAIEEE